MRRAARREPPGSYYGRVALGTLVPGAGLLRTRWRALGWVLLLGALALVGWVAWSVARGGVLKTALDTAVNTTALQVIGVGVAVGAVVWIGSIVLTAQQAWPRRREGRWARGLFALLMCLVVAAPAVLAVRYSDVQSDLVQDVFSDGFGEGHVADPEQPDPWADIPRVNIALLGSDAGRDRIGVRTDSMMVASIDTRTGDALLIGIPRNLENVPIPASNPLSRLWPNGYDCGDACLMNGIWTLATDHPDLFPDDPNPGLTSTIDVLGEITGLDIQRSVVIDLRGFRSLVDAMGGVEVNVTERVCVECSSRPDGGIRWTGDREEWIEPGLQELDGRHALWYARSRAGSDDFSRMRRQRCVAGALLEQADPVSMFARYPQIAQAVRDNVRVSIPQSELQAWVELVIRIQKGDSIRSLPVTSKVVRPASPDFEKIRALVDTAVRAPQASPSSSPSTSPSSSPSPSDTPSSTASPSIPADDSAAPISATC
ncbi:LCP family protein [Oryzobacter terrae]|uniref:LCP family protein n=1 Tax=Oryzobacter terrae TaxID=1620385 RepID=UPI00366D23FC